jgi:hypothetical protein
MYLTAQRVRSRNGDEGINSCLFLHGSTPVPGISWEAPDVSLVAEQHPGTVVVQRIELDSGGNDVLSFLDVVAEDALGIDRLRAAISATELDPARGTTWSVGPVSLRFFRSDASARDDLIEFRSLRDHALMLLRGKEANVRRAVDSRPLEILAEDQEELGVIYRLDQNGQQRLRHLQSNYIPANLRVAYEDRHTMVSLWGDHEYHRHVALAITGLTDDELQQLGGATVRDLHHQLSPDVIARTEELDGQTAGDWFGPDEAITHRTGWPTGAVLCSGDLALDLVYIEHAWFPMSEAARSTYLHTAGLLAGRPWRFVTRAPAATVYRVGFGPSLTRRQVAATYGADAAERCRPDYPAVQLRLLQE